MPYIRAPTITRWGRGSTGFEFNLQRWNNCTCNDNQSFGFKGKTCSTKQEMNQTDRCSCDSGRFTAVRSFLLCCRHRCLLFPVLSLHVAAARGQTDCLSVLLAHGVDLSVADAAGTAGVRVLLTWHTLKSCLFHVVAVRQGGRVRAFFLTAPAGLNPLHLAAKNDHVECCRRLIQVRRISPNHRFRSSAISGRSQLSGTSPHRVLLWTTDLLINLNLHPSSKIP